MSAINWDVVLELLNEVEFYVDAHDRYEFYAEYEKNEGDFCFCPVNSEEFEATLRLWYRAATDQLTPINVAPIIRFIKDEGIYFEEFPKVSPHCRVAGNLREGLEYALADNKRRIVEVKDGEWRICRTAEHKFLTSVAHSPQVEPVKSNSDIFELLARCVNLSGDDLVLFTVWLIQAFSGGSHYGMMLSAERGSGKSTITKTVNKILDPSKADATMIQTNLGDFQTFLGTHYLASFDNVRKIPVDFSDTMAAAITGSTVAKRKLFSDMDNVYLKLNNAIIINGIDIFPSESDLAERFLYFELKRIKADARITDYDIEKYLRGKLPEILGVIFDVLAKASLLIKKGTELNPPRMADAYDEMVAIAAALGIGEKDFRKILDDNAAARNKACANTPIVEAVCEFMNEHAYGKRKIIMSSTLLFNRVKAAYSGPRSALPSRAAEFSKELKKNREVLASLGFQVVVDDTGASGSEIIIIRDK